MTIFASFLVFNCIYLIKLTCSFLIYVIVLDAVYAILTNCHSLSSFLCLSFYSYLFRFQYIMKKLHIVLVCHYFFVTLSLGKAVLRPAAGTNYVREESPGSAGQPTSESRSSW